MLKPRLKRSRKRVEGADGDFPEIFRYRINQTFKFIGVI